jgi:hypothetical protein
MGLEGRCLQRLGAAARSRIGDIYDALSCICRRRLGEGRSGSLQRIEDEFEFEDDEKAIFCGPAWSITLQTLFYRSGRAFVRPEVQ